ncbi:MAG: hypothetical protein U0Y68_20410 [Blastocatellia bacterium]
MKKSIVWSLAIALLATHLWAQAPTPMPTETAAGRTARVKETQELLTEVIATIPNLKLAENKIHVRLSLAHLLWKKEPEQARTLARETIESLQQLSKEFVPGEPQYQEQIEGYYQIRQGLLEVLLQHDMQLAREALRQTRLPTTPETETHKYQEQYAEASLVNQIAQKNPAMALQTMRELLAQGSSAEFTGSLHIFLHSDPTTAAEMANELLKKVRATNTLNSMSAFSMARGLLYAAAASAEIPGATKERPPLLSLNDQKQLATQLLELGLASVNTAERSEWQDAVLPNLQGLLPQLEKLAPNKAAELKAKLPAPPPDQTVAQKISDDFTNLYNNGTVEQMVNAAHNAPKRFQSGLMKQAASKAMYEGKMELAKQILSEHLTDPIQRKTALAHLERYRFERLLNSETPEAALAAFPAALSREERLNLLFQASSVFAEKGKQQQARELLEEAARLLSEMPPTRRKDEQLIRLADEYQQLEVARSFALLEPMVSRLNELTAAAALLDQWQEEKAVRQGEWRMQSSNVVTNMWQNYAGTVSRLAKEDFARALAIANRAERNELRLLVKLRLLQSLLPAT